MTLNIIHNDIRSELCQRCAECCRISFTVSNTDSRYRKFLRQIGYTVLPAAIEGQADCCDQRHDITIDMGYCRHLARETDESGIKFRCNLYGTKDFPQLCGEFDCVSWAHVNNSYNESNATLMAAQIALNNLRARNQGTNGADKDVAGKV